MSTIRHIRELTPEDDQELDACMIYGLELLPIDHEKQVGDFIILSIHMLIEALRMGEPLPAGVSIDDFCTQMGVVYGEQICMKYDWQWKHIEMDNGYEGVAVISPDHLTLIFPIPSIFRWTKKENQNRTLVLWEDIDTRDPPTQLKILH